MLAASAEVTNPNQIPSGRTVVPGVHPERDANVLVSTVVVVAAVVVVAGAAVVVAGVSVVAGPAVVVGAAVMVVVAAEVVSVVGAAVGSDEALPPSQPAVRAKTATTPARRTRPLLVQNE
jgi:hypothetical protein